MKTSRWTRLIVRAFGNFGIAFFSPLVGGNLAETMFNLNMTIEQLVVISFFSAIFVTGLSVSRQAVEWSKEKEIDKKAERKRKRKKEENS